MSYDYKGKNINQQLDISHLIYRDRRQRFILQTPQLKGNIINTIENKWGKFEDRESFLIGPSSKATVFHTTYKIENDGSRTFVTTIPKGEQ